jgi:glycosyltransferase involved in cell wall biosynthesis
MKELPFVSIVVIGLNEEANLDACFQSIINSNYPAGKTEIIYVDSGSKDSSVRVAQKYTTRIYIEAICPSPARNRNRGLIESKYDIVHFIDGDIVMDKDYLEAAINKLLEGEVQCVFGRLEEKSVKGLNKILLHVYGDYKEGIIDAPGAGGTFIKKALIEVNGWDERIPRGEETEIGERLRQSGFKIWFKDQKMGIHDYNIINFSQYLRKQINEGVSDGQASIIKNESSYFKRIRLSVKKNLYSHFLMITLVIFSVMTGYYILIPLTIFAFVIFLFYKYRIHRKITNPDTVQAYVLSNLTRSWHLYGYFKFRLKYLMLPSNDKNFLTKRINIKNILIKQ